MDDKTPQILLVDTVSTVKPEGQDQLPFFDDYFSAVIDVLAVRETEYGCSSFGYESNDDVFVHHIVVNGDDHQSEIFIDDSGLLVTENKVKIVWKANHDWSGSQEVTCLAPEGYFEYREGIKAAFGPNNY